MPRATLASITQSSRRELLSAIGCSSLATIAVAGFVRPEKIDTNLAKPASLDADLLAACRAFEAAHQEQENDNLRFDGNEKETARIGRIWYEALASVTAARRPQTVAGRIALAQAAHVALVDQITGCGTGSLNEMASVEETLALAALDAMRGAGA